MDPDGAILAVCLLDSRALDSTTYGGKMRGSRDADTARSHWDINQRLSISPGRPPAIPPALRFERVCGAVASGPHTTLRGHRARRPTHLSAKLTELLVGPRLSSPPHRVLRCRQSQVEA